MLNAPPLIRRCEKLWFTQGCFAHKIRNEDGGRSAALGADKIFSHAQAGFFTTKCQHLSSLSPHNAHSTPFRNGDRKYFESDFFPLSGAFMDVAGFSIKMNMLEINNRKLIMIKQLAGNGASDDERESARSAWMSCAYCWSTNYHAGIQIIWIEYCPLFDHNHRPLHSKLMRCWNTGILSGSSSSPRTASAPLRYVS